MDKPPPPSFIRIRDRWRNDQLRDELIESAGAHTGDIKKGRVFVSDMDWLIGFIEGFLLMECEEE